MGRRDALVILCRRRTDRRTDGAGKGVTSNGKDRCSNKAVKERTDEQTRKLEVDRGKKGMKKWGALERTDERTDRRIEVG